MNIIVKVKKIGIILLATLIFFTGSFAFPNTEQKAHAVGFGLAVPGGITIGAGTYALGALGVAGMVGLVGYDEYSDEINAHAKGVWEGGTQTAMDSLNWSIESAVGAGNGIVKFSEGFTDFAAAEISGIAATILNVGSIYNLDGDTFRVGAQNGNADVMIFAVKDEPLFYRGKEVNYFSYQAGPNGTAYQGTYKETNVMFDFPFTKAITQEQAIQYQKQMNQAVTRGEVIRIANAMGAGVASGAIGLEYPNVRQKVLEAYRGMRDAGLVLPVDSAVPLSSIDGSPLTYNPTADNYTGIDGGVYEGTPEWAFPQPKLRVANPDIPNSVPTSGVYVDTPVLTGNPTYDDAIINNPAIPKTTTNVQTGVTVGNPDIPNVSNPPIEGEIPPTTPPPSKWEKPPTKKPPNIGALVTTKFPFSLPWDFFGVLGWINAEPKAPVFKLDTGLKTPFGKELKMDMEFKFDFLDDYIGFFRSFIIIGFSLFLILATRRLLGGAG